MHWLGGSILAVDWLHLCILRQCSAHLTIPVPGAMLQECTSLEHWDTLLAHVLALSMLDTCEQAA